MNEQTGPLEQDETVNMKPTVDCHCDPLDETTVARIATAPLDITPTKKKEKSVFVFGEEEKPEESVYLFGDKGKKRR